MSESGQIVAEVAGRQISQEAVISRLKLSGAWYVALGELSDEALVTQAAEKEGLSVNDDELQKEFDDYRLSRGLEKAADTHGWLESDGLAVEEVESCLEGGLLGHKLAEKVIDDAAIEGYYKQNPREFEYARVSHLVVADQGAAEELALNAKEEGEDFAKLARDHSIDEATRCGGGYAGLVMRGDTDNMPDDTADRVFAAKAGDIIGPFASGKNSCVIRVEEAGRCPLDDNLRFALRQQLFGGWLAERTAG